MLIVPAALKRGDAIRVIAPAGPFEVPLLWRGLGFLREHFEVSFSRGIFERQGYLAGDDARRTDELRAAIKDPSLQAIFAARGGYGSTRIADQMPWETLREHPKWLVGFSDITALHHEANAVGVASMHACNVTGLGRSDAHCREQLLAALARPSARRTFGNLIVVRPGHAQGPLIGGNLALLEAMAAAGRLRVPDGAILVIEDVGERPYRIDRMLTSLVVGGHLRNVSAIVAGEFVSCSAGADRTTVQDVLRDRLATLGVPVVFGAPFGHGRVNEPIVLGMPARLDADAHRTATLLMGAEDA